MTAKFCIFIPKIFLQKSCTRNLEIDVVEHTMGMESHKCSKDSL